MMDQPTFTNCVRSLFNIDGYQLPELTSEQQGQFVRDPVRYFIGADKRQQDAIFREVAKRQPHEAARPYDAARHAAFYAGVGA
jgi:hypothetical protein